MKKLTSCAAIALLATVGISMAGSEKDMIMAKEQAAWQAYKDKKADDFKKLVDKDIRCVYAEGVHTLQKELDDMPKWEIKSFTLSDFDSFTDEPDVIVTTCVVKLEATSEGKDLSGSYNTGTVWKKENGEWLAIFHASSKQEAAK